MRRSAATLKFEPGPENYILVVEGDDDFYTMKNLFIRTGLLGKIRIDEGGGFERLRESIETRVDSSGLDRFGVVVDADEDFRSRWQSIRNAFVSAGYDQIPLHPDPAGTIVKQNGRATAGIWIMPNNQMPGELEDFASLLIPDNDTLWPRAITAVNDIPIEERNFGGSVTKAQLHTWLAWQTEPGKPIGQAIVKRYFSTDTPAAQAFLGWINRLFSLDAS